MHGFLKLPFFWGSFAGHPNLLYFMVHSFALKLLFQNSASFFVGEKKSELLFLFQFVSMFLAPGLRGCQKSDDNKMKA